MPEAKKYAIIVAGGSGKRMGAEIPKQFIELNGKPILMYSILAFYMFDNSIEIIVVLPKDQIQTWKSLCLEHEFTIAHKVVEGGQERFHSVKNGLNSISGDGVVGIHDGVRPLVSLTTLENCYFTASKYENAIPVIGVHETVRELKSSSSHTVDRNNYKLVQTPQCFQVSLIKKAFKQDYQTSFTDDASVVEATGIEINLVEGNRENIKITTPIDLKIAEALLVNN